jgi:hypothetical protein
MSRQHVQPNTGSSPSLLHGMKNHHYILVLLNPLFSPIYHGIREAWVASIKNINVSIFVINTARTFQMQVTLLLNFSPRGPNR